MFVKLEEVFGPLNEAFYFTGEKEFHKAFAKATGFKTHAGGYFGPSNNSAHIKINLYDCLNYNKHLPRPGVYGDLEIKRVTPMNEYQQAKMDIVYQGVEMECGVGCFYPPRVAKAKNKQVIDLILKQAGIQADYEIVVKNHQPEIGLSEENFNKIAKIRVGDKIGDFLVYDAGIADTKSVEQYYIVMTSYKEQFAMHVSKNPAMNEGMPSKSEALKFAQTFAKFLGIAYKESDDTWNGAGAFFEISQKGFGKAKKKIRQVQGTKQLKLGELEVFTTGPIVEKLDVDEVEIEDQEGYIRFTKGTKDVYFQSDWAYDDKELLNESLDSIPEYTQSSEMNESTEAVELNEVTGLPKYKTSVPSHML